MESEYFTWDGWDQGDTLCFTFHDVKLLKPIGEFPVGSEFACICVDYGESAHIDFYREGEDAPFAKYEISIQIGNKL